MKKWILLILLTLTITTTYSQDILNGKVTLGAGTAGKWYKIATFNIGCNWNSASIDFDIDYVDSYTALHIDGLIRFRKTSSSYIANWFYYQYGFLNDGLKLKDLGSGNYELLILARGSYGHVMTVLEVNRECSVTSTIFTTKSEVSNPDSLNDVPFFGNFNMPHSRQGIDSNSPDSELTVNGAIHAKEVKVDINVPGPDYVFEEDYPLLSLEEIKSYITENKHLPEVPSAKKMETNGVELGEMNMLLLKKVEELTLHLIEQSEEIKMLKKEITQLKSN